LVLSCEGVKDADEPHADARRVITYMLLLCAIISVPVVAASNSSKPHLLYILADDFGWADSDWHRPDNWMEAATPRMLALLKQGVELDSMYSFKFCAPSRSAIQSGRNPIHVNVQNYQPTVWASDDPARDPVSGFAGIPRNMTGMASVLRNAGYRTTFVGKWDCGMATHEHTPQGRGYDSSLFYFHHDNDCAPLDRGLEVCLCGTRCCS
jgi:arylsulfatase I/J